MTLQAILLPVDLNGGRPHVDKLGKQSRKVGFDHSEMSFRVVVKGGDVGLDVGEECFLSIVFKRGGQGLHVVVPFARSARPGTAVGVWVWMSGVGGVAIVFLRENGSDEDQQ